MTRPLLTSPCNVNSADKVTSGDKFEKHPSPYTAGCIPNLTSFANRLFAIGSQLSPEQGSSGIEMLETDTFKLHCFQTLTGIKFVVLADPRQAGIDSLLRKIYEIYSDFALKNPFYSLEMPIRCELFDQNLKLALEVAEKAGTFGPGS